MPVKIRVGVIAAAGKGTRAYPRTTFIPKPLFRIEGDSILEHNINLLHKKFKVEKIYVLVGHLKEQVTQEVENIRANGLKISIETVPWTTKGLASDVASLESRINEPFITILGDEFYYKTNHEVILKTFQKYPKLASAIGVQKTSVLSRIRKNYSVELDGDRIKNLVEKPSDPPNEFLGLGTYLFTTKYFEFFKTTPPSAKTGVIEITDVIDRMAKETGKVYASIITCNYFNINSMQDYHHAVYEIRNDLFDKFKISVVVPTHNNERSISDVLVDFKDKAHEIVVVDAESTDSTIDIAKANKAKIEYYYHEGDPEEYAGLQIRDGLDRATGDIIILASADGAFRSKDFPKLIEYMKDCDMVIGTRTTRQMIEQGANLKPLARLINLIMGKLVEIFWWGQEP
ncbi:MAG: glycosyltransferase, partial [Leptospira sp.]|nr:glycosyltransferase [Leptospira sp.]